MNTALFNWSDKYSVGIPAMDQHHKKLFSIINELHDAMKAGKAEKTIMPIMDKLIDYTKYHFHEEEVLMEQAKYYGLHFQKQEHMKFIFQLQDLQKEIVTKHDNTLVAIKTSKIITHWLQEHILKVDKRYTDYLKI